MDFQHLYCYVAVGIGLVLGALCFYFTGYRAFGCIGFFVGTIGFDVYLRLHSYHEDRWLLGEEGADYFGVPVWLLCVVLPLVFGLLAWLGYV